MAFTQRMPALWQTLCEMAPQTAEHAERVVDLCRVLGGELGLDAAELAELELAARFHDIGECFLPPGLAGKPLAFTARERALMERHADLGADALLEAGAGTALAGAVRSHHERWDGSGYPRGLAGPAIPTHARIIHVCETWDAMRSNRAYADLISREEALEELEMGAGRQFDPDVASTAREIFAAG